MSCVHRGLKAEEIKLLMWRATERRFHSWSSCRSPRMTGRDCRSRGLPKSSRPPNSRRLVLSPVLWSANIALMASPNTRPPLVGIIGGSGLYKLDVLTFV
ncbi:hypothetical protein BS47DRAFT_240377 [Hydnum rufescens UP504]|uniref:Uncharacterized protein n=1 Tax=Hydnum rufescens UP504 TaxID=1448309 RepID=A0A9P6AM57_9AGAM|nr:hypothetical protein BS47DRAFT_240377 [Hydnum rufescens UP504]